MLFMGLCLGLVQMFMAKKSLAAIPADGEGGGEAEEPNDKAAGRLVELACRDLNAVRLTTCHVCRMLSKKSRS